MRFFIIACEPSGDSHGSHLIDELKQLSPDAAFYGLGGPRMAEAGQDQIYDMTTISALGFGDVLRQYLKYRKIFYQALDEVKRLKPDVIILIDSPAFNLRFAKKIDGTSLRGAKRRSNLWRLLRSLGSLAMTDKKPNEKPVNIPIVYYISPQFWAWGKSRIRVVQRHIQKMLVILPFEKQMYEEAKVPCDFVGHPLLDHVHVSKNRDLLRDELKLTAQHKAVGLLSGSRTKEVLRIFPLMLDTARRLAAMQPQTRFFYHPSGNVPKNIYAEILQRYPDITVEESRFNLHELIYALDFALIASGTVTLETALIGTPYFLMYQASWSTYILARLLIQVKYLGIVNLLAGKRVVPEFIQNDIHPETIAHEAKVLLENPVLYDQMKREFEDVRRKLGEPGASRRAADSVVKAIVESRKSKVES